METLSTTPARIFDRDIAACAISGVAPVEQEDRRPGSRAAGLAAVPVLVSSAGGLFGKPDTLRWTAWALINGRAFDLGGVPYATAEDAIEHAAAVVGGL